jgi:hypothetical protein
MFYGKNLKLQIFLIFCNAFSYLNKYLACAIQDLFPLLKNGSFGPQAVRISGKSDAYVYIIYLYYTLLHGQFDNF